MLKNEKLLIIGTVWVAPQSSAAGTRMLQLIHFFLNRGYHIVFASSTQKSDRKFDLKQLGVEEVQIELNHPSFDEFIKDLNPEIVLFDRFMTEEQYGWKVYENCPKALRILDTEDLHCLRKVREESIQKKKEFLAEDLFVADITKREIASIYRCDLSLIISTFEMELLKNVFNIDPTILWHLPFLYDRIEKKRRKHWKKFEEREHFMFVGNFLHKPNVDAVLQLKHQIWSAIKNQLPTAELHIYGAYGSKQLTQLHNEQTGFLIKGVADDMTPLVASAKVVLAPLRFGAGIKGKLTEAMLNGTPSVTTPIGAEGMHANLPWNGFITDNFQLFAKRAVQLYTDKKKWKEAQENGVTIINQLYDKTQLETKFFAKILQLKEQLAIHRLQNFIGNMLQHQTLQSTKYMSKWIEAKNTSKSES